MRILFQGDSITDAGRDKSDPRKLSGYTQIVADKLIEKYPEIEFEFFNLGISGNRTIDLVNRYESDFKAIEPDIVSILIGINDVWHYFACPERYVSLEGFENNYRFLLQKIKGETNSKILMLEPYLLPAEDKKKMKMDVCAVIERVRFLATTFADEYVPLDGLFARECVKTPWQVFSNDGVHPDRKGQELIAEYYVEAIGNIINNMKTGK